MKKCSFCAEEIQDAAIKCKHCGSDLIGSAQPLHKAVETGIKAEKTKESIGVFMVIGLLALTITMAASSHHILAFLIFFPGLYGIWRYYKS